jgi:predicted transposase/invertase (TIGR01784 family)
MKTINQNPAQSELGPFPFGDGTQIMDIRYDEVFKAVFTKNTEKSRFALSDLISSLIGHTVTVDTINANEPAPDDQRQRHVRFDVSCKTKEDELVNVEMSFNPGADERERLEYHTARLFVGQDIHGKDKKYKDLKKTYQITILAKDKFFPDEYLTHIFHYHDPVARISLGGKTGIITVELVKTKPIVDKPVEEMTNAELWAVFFQYLTNEKKRSKIVEIINHEEGIAMAVQTLGRFTQREIDYIQESYRIKRELDHQSGMAWEREKIRDEAHAEGRNEGLAEGRNEGREEILKLFEQGLSIGEIKERLRN